MDMKEVRKLAFVDELTGLPNRRQFNRVLEEEMRRCSKQRKSIALLLFDLDRFKTINDCHGHEAGDAVIKQFGQRINSCIRKQDVMARLSGDEFAAIITDMETDEEISKLADRILSEMKQAFTYKEREVYAACPWVL